MLVALALLVLSGVAFGQIAPPSYTLSGFTNAASNESGALAPGSLVALYGSGLSFETRSVGASDIRNNRVPTRLPGTAVTVTVGGIPAPLLYVSPTQVNFVIPIELTPGQHRVWLVRDSLAGPILNLTLRPHAPGLFGRGSAVIALAADGRLVTPESPVKPGDWVILYASGLGPVTPWVATGVLPDGAFRLRDFPLLRLLLNGEELPHERIGYAGTAPGFAALYQINFQLPVSSVRNPILQVVMGDQASPANLTLAVLPLQPLSSVTYTDLPAFHE